MGGGQGSEVTPEGSQDATHAELLNYLQTGIGGGVGGLRPRGANDPMQAAGQETIDPNNPNGSPAGRAGQAAKMASAAKDIYEGGSVIGAILGML